jgi:hypothetical protein
VNSDASYITVPLVQASQNKKINTIECVSPKAQWQKKLRQTVGMAYSKAPNKVAVMTLLDEVLEVGGDGIGALAKASIKACCEYLELPVEFINSSSQYSNETLSGQARIIDICRTTGASHYINAIGGKELYDRGAFSSHGVALSFIEPVLSAYPQTGEGFMPGLSILDAIAMVDAERIRTQILTDYQLVAAVRSTE